MIFPKWFKRALLKIGIRVFRLYLITMDLDGYWQQPDGDYKFSKASDKDIERISSAMKRDGLKGHNTLKKNNALCFVLRGYNNRLCGFVRVNHDYISLRKTRLFVFV